MAPRIKYPRHINNNLVHPQKFQAGVAFAIQSGNEHPAEIAQALGWDGTKEERNVITAEMNMLIRLGYIKPPTGYTITEDGVRWLEKVSKVFKFETTPDGKVTAPLRTDMERTTQPSASTATAVPARASHAATQRPIAPQPLVPSVAMPVPTRPASPPRAVTSNAVRPTPPEPMRPAAASNILLPNHMRPKVKRF